MEAESARLPPASWYASRHIAVLLMYLNAFRLPGGTKGRTESKSEQSSHGEGSRCEPEFSVSVSSRVDRNHKISIPLISQEPERMHRASCVQGTLDTIKASTKSQGVLYSHTTDPPWPKPRVLLAHHGGFGLWVGCPGWSGTIEYHRVPACNLSDE